VKERGRLQLREKTTHVVSEYLGLSTSLGSQCFPITSYFWIRNLCFFFFFLILPGNLNLCSYFWSHDDILSNFVSSPKKEQTNVFSGMCIYIYIYMLFSIFRTFLKACM